MRRWDLAILFCFALLLSACANETAKNIPVANSVNTAGPVTTPMPAATIDELASGKKVFADNCVICHKEDGTGGEVVIEGKKLNPDDLSSAKIKGFSDEKIIGYIMNGVVDDGMPAFKDKLSEGEMRDVVKYIRATIQKMPQPEKPAASPKR